MCQLTSCKIPTNLQTALKIQKKEKVIFFILLRTMIQLIFYIGKKVNYYKTTAIIAINYSVIKTAMTQLIQASHN